MMSGEFLFLVLLAVHAVSACKGASTLLRQLLPGSTPMVEVKINGVPRQLLLDSGSADTYLFTDEVTCLDGNVSVPSTVCQLGDLYGGAITPLDGLIFRQVYGGPGSLTEVSGVYAYATVEVAGVVLDKQIVAFANRTDTGQIHTGASGILGLAPRRDEAIYSTENPPRNSSNAYNVSLDYPTVFESMDARQLVEPFFSIAMENAVRGGYLTFGGLPEISFNRTFATAPLASPIDESRQYQIGVDSLNLVGNVSNNTFTAIVDTGTTVCFLPEQLATAINRAFDPPGEYDNQTGQFETSCTAAQPKVEATIGGVRFPFTQSMLVPKNFSDLSQGCTSMYAPQQPGGVIILGSSFLNNVVAVFDVGKEEMRFARHDYAALV
ncbi:hypothetical protein M409DRAFT_24261 [Zasmidium cellare ATCC 36951]|uniref:Peptidase A1 domain-containing protein n=1 Tax=Zasmidium cellare ATCC 36951 TaxID=1080233 RepID=A0A6A6CEA7_ZASCE|nr:uncharacterized protein M409DRAFT_24261 [Zasmidium cellare ATCC 36951]KAF2165411.1 hypothetical protein M409DRAFT_24261 [Zasmidium cellare ATCC 36951]